MSDYRIRSEHLQDFATTVLERAGVLADEAADAADVLVWANRRGVDTHGVRNLKSHYVDKVSDGSIKGHPQFRIEYETPISARVDGDNGLGLVAGCWAMRLAMQKARESGIGMVAMHNS
ncbi:MAG: Ldh family oxidoreductase [Caldilineaceae bacterium]